MPGVEQGAGYMLLIKERDLDSILLCLIGGHFSQMTVSRFFLAIL